MYMYAEDMREADSVYTWVRDATLFRLLNNNREWMPRRGNIIRLDSMSDEWLENLEGWLVRNRDRLCKRLLNSEVLSLTNLETVSRWYAGDDVPPLLMEIRRRLGLNPVTGLPRRPAARLGKKPTVNIRGGGGAGGGNGIGLPEYSYVVLAADRWNGAIRAVLQKASDPHAAAAQVKQRLGDQVLAVSRRPVKVGGWSADMHRVHHHTDAPEGLSVGRPATSL